MPKVSVIIPVYNVEKYLRQCLDSVINQTLKDIEIICINDGSTDSSLEILEEYAQKDKRIKLINQENQGQSISRNIGIDIAQGEYIGFVDSDDYIDYDMYENLYNQAKNLNSDVVICETIRCEEYNNNHSYVINYFHRPISYTKTIKFEVPISQNIDKNLLYQSLLIQPCHSGNKIYRKEFIQKSQIYFPNRRCFEDCIFVLRALLESQSVSYINKPFYKYTVRAVSPTRKIPNRDDLIIETINELNNYINSKNLNSILKKNIDYFTTMNIIWTWDKISTKRHKVFLKNINKNVRKELVEVIKRELKIGYKYKLKNFIKNIFSIYNENWHKVIKILGFKIKFKTRLNQPIDLVYTWVDGNDPKWQEEKLKWQKEYGIEAGDEVNPCRFIDNEELRYSLRSVAKNAPWINHIYIVTNGQIPKWLDTSHPKITIVKHEEIMPKEALPTFNSNAIETCIANIKNLSEHFLYANDDFFIHKPISPGFFFNKNGKPIIRIKKHNWTQGEIESRIYQNNVYYSANLINKKYNKLFLYESHHNIMPYKKSCYLSCTKEFHKEFQHTCLCKFRKLNCVQRTIVSFYEIVHNMGTAQYINKTQYYKDAIVISPCAPKQIKNKLNKFMPYLFCINDNEYTTQDDRIRLKSCLSELYPDIQDWEKKETFQIEPKFKNEDSINIVFCPDNYFAKYFSVAIQSLIDNSSQNKKYDIILFESDITTKNIKLIKKILPENFSVRFIDITPFIFENYKNFKMVSKKNWSISMFYRIFIPLIMQSYKKVLYLDSDICINHNIDNLFNIEMNNSEVGVVKDTTSQILHISRLKEMAMYRTNILKLQNTKNYFNSGMILFNIQNIDSKSYSKRFIETLNIKDLMYPDQDILNLIFEDKVLFLDNKWNYLYGECEWGIHYLNQIGGEYKKKFLEARENPYIIHYTSPRKPWNRPSAEYADIWWKYARKSPFYEEIIYENTMQSSVVTNNTLKNIVRKRKIYFSYYRCKLLSYITFGKTKEHYISKRNNLKTQIRCIREFSKK